MSKYNFDKSINRRLTYSARWNVKEGELPLNIADMDFEVFPEIKKSILNRAELDSYGYIETPKAYFESYINWWNSRHHINLDINWFCFSTSVVGSIDSIFKHLGHKNEQVVMFTPIYNVFFNCIKNNGLKLKECPFVLFDNEFKIDFKKLEKLLKSDKTKFFLLCNPHNPIGRKFEVEELNQIIELCQKYDVYLISDEIHADIDFNKDKYNSIFSSPFSKYEKIILLLSPSKIFNLAGLQSSVVVIPFKELKELVQSGLYMDDIGEPNYFAIDPVITAFNNGHRYVEELNSYLNENKAYLKEFIGKNLPNLKLLGGEFTYLMWIDISSYSNDSYRFCLELRNETGLILSPGINYGEAGEGYIRINIATPKKNLVDALNRLENFILERRK